MTTIFTRAIPWVTKRIPLIHCINMVVISLIIFTYTYPPFAQPSEAEWQGSAASGAAIVGVALGIAAGGITVFAGTPAIALGLGIGASVAVIISGGLWLWDELTVVDNCYDCDGRGCSTCQPPDDDGCPNCDGRGCSTCQ